MRASAAVRVVRVESTALPALPASSLEEDPLRLCISAPFLARAALVCIPLPRPLELALPLTAPFTCEVTCLFICPRRKASNQTRLCRACAFHARRFSFGRMPRCQRTSPTTRPFAQHQCPPPRTIKLAHWSPRPWPLVTLAAVMCPNAAVCSRHRRRQLPEAISKSSRRVHRRPHPLL